ncbi:MAG: aminoglycoside phosphotransferase family protein [Eubacteriales bacterium]
MVPDSRIGKQIGEGYTSEVFLWPDKKIIKLFRSGLPKELCIGEFEATRKIHECIGVCPKPFELIEVDGKTGIVYERITGESMLRRIMRKLWTYASAGRKLARLQLSFQKEVDFPLISVSAALKRNINYISEITAEEKAYLNQYIDSLPDGNCLCHFDFHPGNVLVQDDKYIVIDWMTASKGNPLADAARTSVLLRFAETTMKPAILNLIITKIRMAIHNEYMKEYISAANVRKEDIEAWELPIMAARLLEWIPPNEKAKLLKMVQTKIHEANILVNLA